ncbi:MAG: dihydrolipoyl dehydrogenase [Candidatus Latescibacteria bacterium]|nr:dihydrolipoyl dehydrogenase [Candidatus Latescibacterota bacterium]
MNNPEIVIIGAGPAGYVCAIRLGQLGRKVLLVDKDKIGGVCLNRGCIPTKALLHYTQIISEANSISRAGIKFTKPEIDLPQFNRYIQNIPLRLRKGVEFLLRENNIDFIKAEAKFEDNSALALVTLDGITTQVKPQIIIIANGSENTDLPYVKSDQTNIINSDQALILNQIPKRLTIFGAGAVGLEFATIYNRLGSKIQIIELMPQILPGTDLEIADHLMNILKKQGVEFMLNSTVTEIKKQETLQVIIRSNDNQTKTIETDKILLAVGRIPNTDNLGLNNTNIELTAKKFIKVNPQFETSVKNIYAIGDIIGAPLLAHKAMAQGVYLAEKICGLDNISAPKYIPNCIYTDPEIATVGLCESELKNPNYDYVSGKIPLSAIGRAHTLNRIEGFAKILVDKKSKKILGAHILSPEASNLINEFTLAMNAELTIDKIIETVHPHPTLSEIVQEAAAAVDKKAIHILNK